jgi:hypothetical protein
LAIVQPRRIVRDLGERALVALSEQDREERGHRQNDERDPEEHERDAVRITRTHLTSHCQRLRWRRRAALRE